MQLGNRLIVSLRFVFCLVEKVPRDQDACVGVLTSEVFFPGLSFSYSFSFVMQIVSNVMLISALLVLRLSFVSHAPSIHLSDLVQLISGVRTP